MKILAFAGSTRTDSFNKKLIAIGSEQARSFGAEVTLIDLRDFPMPLYDGDLEAREGLPPNARKLKELFITHDALLISSPEYNSSITGVLKNSLDWVSRSEPGEAPLKAYNGKIAGLLSASPGALGGLRSLVVLRSMLGNIQVLVIPQQFALGHADKAFDANGQLQDAKSLSIVQGVVKALVETTRKMKAEPK